MNRRLHLTSLVLQMSLSADPQAFPGVAFHGIIPVVMKFTGFIFTHSFCHQHNNQENK